MAINIERQLSAEPPCRDLYEYADAMLARPGVLMWTGERILDWYLRASASGG
jgi:hypothetical protein